FFFSSRRRHTRSKRDWSSDVCSSDLTYFKTFGAGVPSDSEEPPEITEDGFVKFTVDDVYPELYMNVSENVETKIIQNDQEHLLYEMFESNTSVKISIENRPLFLQLTGGLI